MGEEHFEDRRFRELVQWLYDNEPPDKNLVFVHGDFNTANVLISNGAVSGVLDWEFAGIGWKEYELAWALRARTRFLNSAEERAAVLTGYESTGTYDASQLRWCEVLNYLHFAGWSRRNTSDYCSFALSRAAALL
jgi:aminoglycoside phosphotransferase (APT) family kinase protein